MFLPLFAAVVVLFPLLAGWRGTVGVVVMETVGQAFAVFKFSPVVITVSGWLYNRPNQESPRSQLIHNLCFSLHILADTSNKVL